MAAKRLCQINNLKIVYDEYGSTGRKYKVIVRRDGTAVVLEEFRTRASAERWCRKTTDFCSR